MSRIDPGTLGWVKTEIDETLKQARLALETFAENTSDNTSLRFCNTYLHQVVGTLQMVELDGAAMLARENEALAQAILDGKATSGTTAFETLVRGILSLPDYLARIQHDQPDVPLRLLPIINELRAARSAASISELDLFSPDLTVRPPARPGERAKASEEEFNAAAKAQRGAFQTALLNWLRDVDSKASLSRMVDVLSALQDKAHIGFIEQLFWIAAGYVDALAAGMLEVTTERKKFLGRVDQQIKKFVDGSDKTLQRTSSESLAKTMLFELGSVKSGEGRVGEIRRAFDLEILSHATAGEVTSELYDMPTPEALRAVSDALGKEIQSAQDQLSAYFDPEHEEARSLEPLLELLQRMSGTLGLLGVSVLKALVDELLEVGRAISTGKVERTEAVAMPMAGALLLIESCARDFHKLGPAWKKQIEEAIGGLRKMHSPGEALPLEGIEISDAGLSDSEFKQLLRVVSGEIRVNLGKVEEILETFAATPERLELLQPVPQHLSQIQGALQILGQDRVAELTAATSQYIQEVQGQGVAVDNAMLDALAVAVGTIGAYIEGLERGRSNLENLLDVAWRDLDTARGGKRPSETDAGALVADTQKNLEAWLGNPADLRIRGMLQQDLRDLAQLAGRQSQDRIARICNEMNSVLGIVSMDPGQFSGEIQETLRQSAQTLSNLVRQHLALAPEHKQEAKPEPVPEPKLVPSEKTVSKQGDPVKVPAAGTVVRAPPGLEDLDEEIMEIFVEDAREIIQVIDRTLPEWRKNPENRDVLLELRRAFHTLKGSGRMVGASVIAELAWAVENMLNRVREDKIHYSDQMFELLFEVHRVLPVMTAQLEGGPAPEADIDALRNRADAFASNSAAELPVIEPPVAESVPLEMKIINEPAPAIEIEPESGADAEVSIEPDAVPGFDPVLLQIFTGETRGHLATIKNTVEESRASGSACLVSEALLRAAHTLQGSSRALSLRPMAECCSELEKLLQAFEIRQQPLTDNSTELLSQVAAGIEELIEALNAGASPSGRLQHHFADLAHALGEEVVRLLSHEPGAHEVSAPERQVPAPQPPAQKPPDSAPAPMRPAAPVVNAPPRAIVEETILEETDPELLEIFLEEAVDILGAVEEALSHWRSDRSDSRAVQDLKRSLHTLKGGARMAGAMTMGGLSHNTEGLLKEVEDRRIDAGPDLLDLLDEVHDALVTMVDQMQNRKPVSGIAQLNAKVMAMAKGEVFATPVSVPAELQPVVPPPKVSFDEVPDAEPEEYAAVEDSAPLFDAEPTFADSSIATEAGPEEIPDRRSEPLEVAEAGTESSERRGQIRVRTSLLSNLVNYAGEVSISRSRMQQQIYGFRENLAELNRNVIRFRDQIRELEIHSESQILYRAEQSVSSAGSEFDPLEFDRFSRLQQLSRGLAESLHDLYTIQSSMDTFVGEAETVLQQQARVNTELQEGLMRTRMISFSTQAARLRHIVRQTARELGKRVELQLAGAEVEVDRTVLDRMIGPFEHMIRNSIDHGVEDEATRKRAGKPAVAKISINTSHEGSEVVIRFIDDGAGLNIAAIRAKAIERGLMAEDATLSEEELMQFILVSGFSTASKITHLSGRGVGMDVVHNEIKQLGGSITVDTKRGAGTTFIIRLPLTLSITQALMVYVGERMFAIPLSSVVNILEVPVERLNSISVGKKPLLNHEGQVYPFMHLGARLDIPALPQALRKVPVLLTRSGSRQMAMQVDALGGTQEVVIKSLGLQLSRIAGLSGATILGDGRVILILDVPGLWLTEERLHVVARAEPKEPEAVPRRPLVMVVDDSITVRKVTSRYLQKHTIDVAVAKDGIDALEQLREQVPDVMLVDIEMPRMDGYELTTNVRSDPALKHIPIIMITSRAGTKHRDRALQLGVNLYMTKPYQEDELLKNISALLPRNLRQ
ncbi:MAG: hybrid sensor histidine kinase/response regulator [Acidiferrobacterales bacterium]